MREIFTLLVALCLSASASAQSAFQALPTAARSLSVADGVSLAPGSTRQQAPQRKIAVAEGQHMFGFYTTDDLPNMPGGYLMTGYTGSNLYANYYEGEILDRYIGGSFVSMRFAVACSIYVSNAFIYEVSSEGYIGSQPLAEVAINSTLSAGWNDVTLDEPVPIEEGKGYLLGFGLTEDGRSYPLVTDFELDVDYTSDYGFFMYMTYYGSTGWYYLGNSYGSLCIQAVVAGGNFGDNDIVLRKLSAPKFVDKDNKKLAYSIRLCDYGNNAAEKYTLSVAVDDEVVQTLDTPTPLAFAATTYSDSLDVSALAAAQKHTLTVSVATINGEAPTEYTDDDVLSRSFMVYEGEMPARQQHLIEQFTSIYCQYCPLGTAMLEVLVGDHPDKYAWTACHSIGQGNDTLALYQDDYLTVEYYLNVTGYPEAAFDRAPLTSTYLELDDDYIASIGFYSSYHQSAANAFDTAVDEAMADIPNFVTLAITPEYDADTREVKITVSGEGCNGAKSYLDGCRLTVYLTEDGIAGRQYTYNESTGRASYQTTTHNNVLRAISSTYEWGDEIGWTSETAFENTLTATLDNKWDDSQMYITAFISGPMAVLINNQWYYNDIEEGIVYNTLRVKLTDTPAGINAVVAAGDDEAQTYYSLDGRVLTTPQKGVNIVRNGDGTTKKVVVK